MHVLIGLLGNIMSIDGKYGNNNKEEGKYGGSWGSSGLCVCLCGGSCREQEEKRCLLGSTSHSTLANQHRVNLKPRPDVFRGLST